MKLDDLKTAWMAEVASESHAPRLDTLTSEVAKLRRDVRMRDFWMIFPLVAAAGGSVFFNWWTRDTVTLMSQLSVGITVIFAMVVTITLLNARRATSRDNWTLRARLEREIEKSGRQVSLLRNVGYWFILPMLLTIVITSMVGEHERTGRYLPSAISWALYLASLSISAITVWLCRREAKRAFIPSLLRLKELHRELVDQSG